MIDRPTQHYIASGSSKQFYTLMLHRYNAGMNESFLVNVIVIDPYLSSEQNRILPEKLINIPGGDLWILDRDSIKSRHNVSSRVCTLYILSRVRFNLPLNSHST